MIKAMRKGSLLILLAVICAATLTWSPSYVAAADSVAWTNDSPGGGAPDQGDPDDPIGKPGPGMARLSYGVVRGSVQTDLAGTAVTGVSAQNWLQALLYALRIRLGW